MKKPTPQSSAAKLVTALLLGCAVAALVLAVDAVGTLEGFRLKALDLLYRKAAPARPPHPDIVVVAVDQASVEFYQDQGITWPWPRQMYAPIVDYCTAAGAQGVVFDVLYTEASSYGAEDDQTLAHSLKQAGNATLAFFLSRSPRKEPAPGGSHLPGICLNLTGPPCLDDPGYASLICPIPPLAAAARGLGNVENRPDPDGVFRSLPLAVPFGGKWWPQLALAAYLSQFPDPCLSWQGHSLRLTPEPTATGIDLPLLPDGRFLLHFRAGEQPFRRFSAANVIQSYCQWQAGEAPIYPLSDFAGKWVLVGFTAAGLYDLKPTPLSPICPGVEIQATLLANLLDRDFLVPVSRPALMAITLAVSAAAAVTVGFGSLPVISAALAGFFVLLAGGGALLFRHGLWLDLVPPMLALVFSYIASAAYSYSTEGRQKREIRRVFSHYMSDLLISDILKHPDKLHLGGERRELTLFFSDLAGFTSISEQLSPEELVHLLNDYLSHMTDIILAHGGIIDKYEGDAIMAFWGAPVAMPDHAARACLAAWAQQQRLTELRREWSSRGLPEISARMGINTGEVIVGNMGSSTRFDFTVIGDAVNLASRLEGANKSYGSGILISDTTAAQVQGQVELRELDLITVKGREAPVRVYEVLGPAGQLSPAMAQARERFARGLALYRAQRWDEAQAVFAQVLEAVPGDPPATAFRSRCQNLAGQDLGPDWDGVYRLTTK